MLEFMDQSEFENQYLKVAEKMRQGQEISRQERILLLMALLLGRETRKESRYGQS
jgi:hypothetical protein